MIFTTSRKMHWYKSYRYPTDPTDIHRSYMPLSWCLGNWLRMLEAALQALVAFAMSSSTIAEASPPCHTCDQRWCQVRKSPIWEGFNMAQHASTWFNMVQHGSTVGPALPWFIPRRTLRHFFLPSPPRQPHWHFHPEVCKTRQIYIDVGIFISRCFFCAPTSFCA